MSRLMKNIVKIYKIIIEFSKMYFFVSIIQVIIQSVKPFIPLVFVKLLIDSLVSARPVPEILFIAALFFGLDFACAALGYFTDKYINVKNKELNMHFNGRLGLQMMTIDYEYLEDPQILDKREKAAEGISESGGNDLSSFNNNIIRIISACAVFLGSAYIISTLNVVIILLIAAIITVNGFVNKAIASYEHKSWSRWIPLNRQYRAVFQLMYNFQNAKDIRLYNASGLFVSKVDKYNEDSYRVMRDEAGVTFKYGAWSTLAKTLQSSVVYGYTAYQMVTGAIGVGSFMMYISAVNEFSNSIQMIIKSFVDMNKSSIYMGEYLSFFELKSIKSSELLIPENKPHSFEFKNVYFKYKGSNKYALKNISFKIDAGESAGLVGLNGSGKTTLVKLLLRLYDADQGQILMDGIDIRQYDYNHYIKSISATFQDFNIYSCTVKENISFGSESKPVMPFIKAAGLDGKVSKFDKGMDTTVLKIFDDEGIELSGGENQKLAFARSLYKESPTLILDEPTSALDAAAEFEMYEHFKEVSKDKTCIFISHRLASCKFCHKIIVLENSELMQIGTHDELVRQKGGVYERLFNIQAKHLSA